MNALATVNAETPPDDGLIRMDEEAHRAWQGARELELTRNLFRLLAVLYTNAGKVVSHDTLTMGVWGSTWIGKHALSVNVGLLRKALGENAIDPQYITNIRGVGYRLEKHMVPGPAQLIQMPDRELRLPLRGDGQLLYDAAGALVAVAMSPRAAAWLVECTRQQAPELGAGHG